jgi:hypothetical protein
MDDAAFPAPGAPYGWCAKSRFEGISAGHPWASSQKPGREAPGEMRQGGVAMDGFVLTPSSAATWGTPKVPSMPMGSAIVASGVRGSAAVPADRGAAGAGRHVAGSRSGQQAPGQGGWQQCSQLAGG